MPERRDRRAFFRRAYEKRPPWDIGRPQREMVALADEGLIRAPVLDVGCGTGDNALLFAERGLAVLGVDLAENAIQEARRKAAERGLAMLATFSACDVLAEPPAGRTFATVTDSGFFHSLSDEDRVRFEAVLRELLAPGGRYLMLCFSERVPGTFGPRRVTEAEIHTTFAGEAWADVAVRPARLESSARLIPWVPAHLAIVERSGV